MMKLIAGVAALSMVSAADVPVFSSNDDYDEINLNIRLLQANGTAAKNVTMTVLTGALTTKYTWSGTTAALCTKVKPATESALATTLKAHSAAVTACADSRRRQLEATRELSTEKSIKQDYTASFTTAAAASAAETVLSSPAFKASFVAAMTTELASVSGVSAPTVETVGAVVKTTTVNGQVVTPAPTTPAAAAPTPTPAPSPSPSSDASMIKATTAIVAAVVASLF